MNFRSTWIISPNICGAEEQVAAATADGGPVSE